MIEFIAGLIVGLLIGGYAIYKLVQVINSGTYWY